MEQDMRKTIKITLPESFVKTFEIAKRRAEETARVKFTDTQYASRLVQWALYDEPDGKLGALEFDGDRHIARGVQGSRELKMAIWAAYLIETHGYPPESFFDSE
jgi:hypothetical protein